jgi:hypothetical protein
MKHILNLLALAAFVLSACNPSEIKNEGVKDPLQNYQDDHLKVMSFNIKVDNKKVEYEKLDDAFIGVKISQGTHEIEIEYKAPLKTAALFLSIIGIICFITITILESKRKI